jgi:FkbM family methyltransferase
MTVTTDAAMPNVAGSLEDWLESQIERHAAFFRERPLLLDIGAYHGDFSRRFAGSAGGVLREAILFEPNPENFNALREAFAGDKRFRLENCACADRAGSAKLFCQGERYTGSLLAYQNERPGPKNEHTVKVTTVDEILAGSAPRVGLIKIDTQGNDLRVLQGAVQALRASRPWLIVEMLATPRFVNQANPIDVMQFLAGEKYFLAAQFNEYYTATGWLAWYDACFVPLELFSMEATANVARPSAAEAASEKGGLAKKLGRIFKAG